jgi:hypothetical protein
LAKIIEVRIDDAVYYSVEDIGSVLAMLAFVPGRAGTITIEIIASFLESNSVRLGG